MSDLLNIVFSDVLILTDSARAALSLSGTLLGFSPIKVLPSKTAILPVNPTFLPRVRVNHYHSYSFQEIF